jgi:hypothetical protein
VQTVARPRQIRVDDLAASLAICDPCATIRREAAAPSRRACGIGKTAAILALDF